MVVFDRLDQRRWLLFKAEIIATVADPPQQPLPLFSVFAWVGDALELAEGLIEEQGWKRAETQVLLSIAALVGLNAGGNAEHGHRSIQGVLEFVHLQPAVVDAHGGEAEQRDVLAPGTYLHGAQADIQAADGIGLAFVQPPDQHHPLMQQRLEFVPHQPRIRS